MKKIKEIINNIVDSKKDYDVLVVNAIINQNKPMQNKLSKIKKIDKKINSVTEEQLQDDDDFYLLQCWDDKRLDMIESLSKDIQNWIKKHNKSYMAIMNSLIEEGRKLLGE